MKSSSYFPDSDSSAESESEEDECTCGALDTGHRAHHPICSMNPRNLMQNAASVSIQPRLGDYNSKIISAKPIVKASGPSSEASQKKSLSLATESPLFSLCRGIEKEPMIACDNPECVIEWYFNCVGITEYCDSCVCKQSVEDTCSSTTVRK